MGNIQIYSWVINCGGALSYSYFMGRKDNNLISFPLCVCMYVCVLVCVCAYQGLCVRSARSVCVCIVSSLNIQHEVQRG